mmetsp:Transcript_3647/g.6452  ORF Transcript_3647/g.6452 Transcript_3647/m.6452 type:complete len:221 (+) Transcript_3647:274-936(+)
MPMTITKDRIAAEKKQKQQQQQQQQTTHSSGGNGNGNSKNNSAAAAADKTKTNKDGSNNTNSSNKEMDNSNNTNTNTNNNTNTNKQQQTTTTATDVADARESYKGNLFLVLEYVSHDLTGLLDVAYKFGEREIKCIFRQLLEALRYMHDQKYVHRDIKSSNILIDRNFRLKLADFGLARSIEPPLLDKLQEYVQTKTDTLHMYRIHSSQSITMNKQHYAL